MSITSTEQFFLDELLSLYFVVVVISRVDTSLSLISQCRIQFAL